MRPATSGAITTDAPMVASHPPMTAPQAVAAGRTVVISFAIVPLLAMETDSRWRPCKTRAYGLGREQLGERRLRPRSAREQRREVERLPRQVEVGPAEEAVRRGLPIERTTQLEAVDDHPRPEIEMLIDERPDAVVAHAPGAERLDVQRDRPRASDDVGDLDLDAVRETRGYDVLRDVARGGRGGAIHLRRVLAADRATVIRPGS